MTASVERPFLGRPAEGRPAGERPGEEPPADDGVDLRAAVEVLRALADETRLTILGLLAENELPVTAIATALDRPIPAISQHLARLRAARLVVTRRAGTTIYYRQANDHVRTLVRNTLQQAEHVLFDEPPHHREEIARDEVAPS